MSVQVRPACPADAEAVTRMIRALNRQQGDPEDRITPDRLRDAFLGPDPAGLLLVAEAEGKLIGYTTGHPTYETGFAARGRYVGDLWVEPAHRRRGVATALLAALAAQVRAEGGDHLWFTAKSWNTGAHALYRRLGAHGEEVLAFAVAEGSLEHLAGRVGE